MNILAHSEEWRPIPSWPEYEVSSLGRVRRVAVYHHSRAGRVLTLRATAAGYLRAALCRNSKVTHTLVHRLVAEAFLPAPLPGQIEVAHRNSNPSDNVFTNLRWDTSAGNAADRWEHGTYKAGEEHFAAKVTWELAQQVRQQHAGGGRSLKQLAKQHGLSKTTVAGIVRGERWATPGPHGQAITTTAGEQA
jgi:hypothetical protein